MSTSPAPDPAPATRAGRLQRPTDDRWLAGVCSGIAREIGVDPLVVRVVALVLALFGGAGLLVYIICVLLIPAEGEQDGLLRKAVDGEDRTITLGLVLLGLVVFAVVSDGWFFGFWDGWGGFVWLALCGLVLLWFLRREDRQREAAGAGGAPATAVAGGPVDPDAPTAVFGDTPPPAAPRPRSSGRLALGVTLVGIGLVGAIGALSGDSVRWDILMASTIIGLGAVLVIAAPFGGARALIPLGLLLATGTGIAAAADLELSGGAGERVYRPQIAAELKSEYHLAAGRQELDLRDVALPDGVTKVKLEQGFGELIVRVPERSRVQVDAEVSGGEVEALGRESNGFEADVDLSPTGTGPVLDIDAHVGFGYIGIVRGDDPVGHGRGPDRPGAISLGALR